LNVPSNTSLSCALHFWRYEAMRCKGELSCEFLAMRNFGLSCHAAGSFSGSALGRCAMRCYGITCLALRFWRYSALLYPASRSIIRMIQL
jgi:hypothetical protein